MLIAHKRSCDLPTQKIGDKNTENDDDLLAPVYYVMELAKIFLAFD